MVTVTMVVSASALGALVWQLVTTPARLGIDGWAYLIWGQAIVRGQRPTLGFLLTAPKPFAYLLGLAAQVLPVQRAFQSWVDVFATVMMAALAVAVTRGGGLLGVPVAVALLAASAGFAYDTQLGAIDLVTAAFVALSVATRGRWRIAAMVAAGLLRPEAWPLVPMIAYLELDGTRLRRAAGAGGLAVIAPAIWAASDVAANGRPFMFLVVGRRDFAVVHYPQPALIDLPHLLGSAVLAGLGWPGLVLGLCGLAVSAVVGLRAHAFDPVPLLVAVGWSAALMAEFFDRLPNYARYTAPLAAVLAIGAGQLVGLAARGRVSAVTATIAACTCSTAAITAAVVSAPLVHQTVTPLPALVAQSLPVIERVLRCGQLAIVQDDPAHQRPVISMTAALADRPLSDFQPIGPLAQGDTRKYPAVLRPTGSRIPLRPGVHVHVSTGIVSTTEACARTADLTG